MTIEETPTKQQTNMAAYQEYTKDEQGHIRMLMRRRTFLAKAMNENGEFPNKFIRMEYEALVWTIDQLANLELIEEEAS
jgi:hypothetical protein